MFSPIKSQKVYEVVIEQIKEMIKTGKLKKGDKLPPERELAEELNVSRTSVREALRSLEILGLVESRHGDGNFIKESFDDSLIEPISLMFMLQESSPRDILELRMVLETETASLAAKKVSSDELQEIKAIIDKFKITTDERLNTELDVEFHHKIAKASKNLLLVNILSATSVLIDTFISDARYKIIANGENKTLLVTQHEAIYKALLSKDESKAAAEMRNHLELINKSMCKS
ncbi:MULTISPECIES: FadR/GntR family transcriptional regulator [Clostridium]|uniref:FadR/GntR family transcriptional regulator n=1 Tax=Clostridium TaxID=1485 RepID=UPI000826ED17|nr:MULTISPECIES: FadR/GntR family transcriptional regulator [Clostridium]PJI09503.1 FadR family transcriptional regulator [Clostridium sp. CT7]